MVKSFEILKISTNNPSLEFLQLEHQMPIASQLKADLVGG